jgi:hypothetical protein
MLLAAAAWGCSGEDAPPPQLTDALTAEQLLEKLRQAEPVTSFHMVQTVTVRRPSGDLRLRTDAEFGGDKYYAKSTLSGQSFEVLILGEAACARLGGFWQSVPLPFTIESLRSSLGSVDPAAFPAPRFERLADEELSGGGRAYALRLQLRGGELKALLEQASALIGIDQAEGIEAMTLVFHFDQQSLHLRRLAADYDLIVEGRLARATMDVTYDRFNQPARFPSDLPPACPRG